MRGRETETGPGRVECCYEVGRLLLGLGRPHTQYFVTWISNNYVTKFIFIASISYRIIKAQFSTHKNKSSYASLARQNHKYMRKKNMRIIILICSALIKESLFQTLKVRYTSVYKLYSTFK